MTLFVRNLSDQIVALIRDRILSGAVPSDKPIRQDALAVELGVSKIPIREALAKLEQDGLVANFANRGFFVCPLDANEAEEVYALRLRLEPDAVALAAARAGPEDRRIAIETLDTLDEVTDRHGEGVGAFNRAFHLALLRPADRPVTLSMLERLHILSERYVRKHLEPLGRDDRANAEHREMLDAWLAGDRYKVAALTEAHIAKTLDDLRQQLAATRPAADRTEKRPRMKRVTA